MLLCKIIFYLWKKTQRKYNNIIILCHIFFKYTYCRRTIIFLDMTVIFFIMMMQQYCIYYYHSKTKKKTFFAVILASQTYNMTNKLMQLITVNYTLSMKQHVYSHTFSLCNMMSVVREHDMSRCFHRPNSSIFLSTMYTHTYVYTNIHLSFARLTARVL